MSLELMNLDTLLLVSQFLFNTFVHTDGQVDLLSSCYSRKVPWNGTRTY